MAAIDFPAAPTLNQIFSAPNGTVYKWNGTLWLAGPTSGGVATPVYVVNPVVINDPSGFPSGSTDTAMLITQGTQIFSQVFTALDPTHPIEVDCYAMLGTTNSQWEALALYIDGVAAPVRQAGGVINTFPMPFVLKWSGVLAAGPHTFSVRFGGSGNSWVNGNSAVRIGGGAQAAWLRITEVGVGPVGPQGPPGPTGGPVTAPTYDSLGVLVTDNTLFPTASGDTVMQITNGTQLFSRSFTAVDPTHPIEVDVSVLLGGGAGQWGAVGLFIDGVAAAVRQTSFLIPSVSAIFPARVYWQGVLAAGAHVFSVRFGGSSTTYASGSGGVRVGGGAQATTMAIRELGVGPVGPQGPAGPQSLFLQSRLTQFFTPVAGTALIPFDNTPPLVGEGTALTSVTITPTAPTNRIRVTVKGVAYGSVTAYMIMAMFVGAAASANYSTAVWNPTNTGAFLVDMIFEYVPGTVALQTISLRYGPDRACTMAFNQSAGVGVFNGTSPLNILVEELTP